MIEKKKQIICMVIINLFLISLISADNFYEESPIREKVHEDLWSIIDEGPIKRFFGMSPKEVDVLVQLKEEKELGSVEEMILSNDALIEGKYKVGDVIVAKVPVNKLVEMSKDDKIDSIWPNQKYELFLEKSVPQINAPSMWDRGYNGSGVKVAIIDTGVDSNHLDFDGRIIMQNDFVPSSYIVNGEQYGDGDDDSLAQDYRGHGTHCAGIAAGAGSKYKGVAPSASIIAANVFGESTAFDSWVIAGINWAVNPDGDDSTDDGADIISLSLGHLGNEDGPLNNAVRDAIAKGVVVVISSGNNGANKPAVPANVEEAITVGAVDDDNRWASFSSGYNYSGYIKPDVVAPGVGIIAPCVFGSDYDYENNHYCEYRGTSMAAPHVTGAVALLLQSNPNLTPKQVKEILEKTATPLGDYGKDTKYGSGLINANKFISSSIEDLLNYNVEIPEFIYVGDLLDIQVNVASSVFENISAIVKKPDGTIKKDMSFFNSSLLIWKSVFTDTNQEGSYNVFLKITEEQGKVIYFNETFDVIKYNLTEGKINDLLFTSPVGVNEVFNVSLLFSNKGNTSLDTRVEVQLLDSEDNVLSSKKSDMVSVSPDQDHTFEINLTTDFILGNHRVKAIAIFEGKFHVKEKNLVVIDNIGPQLVNISFEDKMFKGGNFRAKLEIDTLSDLNGSMYITKPSGALESVPLKTLFRINPINIVTATFYNATEVGTYRFYFSFCNGISCVDTQNYQFEVGECTKPNILIVDGNLIENPSKKYVDVLEDDYCLSLWSLDRSGVPDIEYMSSFKGVIWTSGNNFGDDIDEESVILLEDYIGSGGRIILEGSDIASTHRFDVFMKNITGSVFREEFDKDSVLSIDVQYPHIIFKNLPKTLEFNSSACFYPDSLRRYGKGVNLANWSVNGSAIIGSDLGDSKVLFFPFMIEALDHKNQIIKNIGEWLMIEEQNADVLVSNIDYEYLVEGESVFNVEILNNGSKGADSLEVGLFVNGVLESTYNVDIDSYNKKKIEFSSNLDSGENYVEIKLNLNSEVVESNYFNNVLMEYVSVAKEEADIVLERLYFALDNNSAEIIAEIGNIGGRSAVDIPVDFYIEDRLTDTKYVDIDYNEELNVSFEGFLQEVSDVKVLVNEEQVIHESNYTNNNNPVISYLCSEPDILIISDNDMNSSLLGEGDLSSAEIFGDILRNNDYCVVLWGEAEKGIPEIDYLNQFGLVIWSSGRYWDGVINEEDMVLLEQYRKNILFEGSDIGLDHNDDDFMRNYLHAVLGRDLSLNNSESLSLNDNEILESISEITINNSLDTYPDSVIPVNGGVSLAEWEGLESAMISYEDENLRRIYFAFSIDGVESISEREKLVLNSVKWLFSNDTRPSILNETLREIGNDSSFILDETSNETYLEEDEVILPQFINLKNLTVLNNESLSYLIEVDSGSNIGCFSINTTDFMVDCMGYLRNSSVLSVGKYFVNISVNDTFGNKNSEVIFIDVIGINNTFFSVVNNVSPNNKNISVEEVPFNISANINGDKIDSVWINITRPNFSIFRYGMKNVSFIDYIYEFNSTSIGSYEYEVFVDGFGNVSSKKGSFFIVD